MFHSSDRYRGDISFSLPFPDVMVEFTVASRNVSMREDAGSVVLTVAASGSLAQPVNVSYATRNGLAIGEDNVVYIQIKVTKDMFGLFLNVTLIFMVWPLGVEKCSILVT